MMAVDPSDAIIDLVAALLEATVGLQTASSHRARLRGRIRDEAAALGLSPEGYYRELTARPSLRQNLINRITVQETSFFRHPDYFDVLARNILPVLTQPITLWSAGCANGQEAYSLAMLLEEQGIAGSVIASDVSTEAVRRTSEARYSTREIAGLSTERMSRHLIQVGDEWEISQRLRNRVVGL
ncbi:protein-glutamate O-methyltransferase CheR, partial [Cryobacterium sp. MLB-32]|uniref:CheR family methyltransferase n=1 Tax=Cryobacterium sp. MLB-32 TaxID=1529318 RepID=UPI0018CEA6EB